VTIVVSAGPRPVTIRNVVGKAEETALEELAEQHLSGAVAEEREYSEEVPEGHVISQAPEQGTEGHEGDEVVLTISKGPELFEVPSVTFMRYTEAKELLEEAGFTVERKDWFGGALGTVRFQDPDPGTWSRKGTVVTLTVI